MRLNYSCCLILLIFLTAVIPARAQSSCLDLYSNNGQRAPETPEEFDVQIHSAENDAVNILKKMQINEETARKEIREWFEPIRDELKKGDRLSVMEHTALLHLLRSGLIKKFNDSELTLEIESSLILNWQRLTGKELDLEKVLVTRLPAWLLGQASYRENQFHEAVFRNAKDVTSVEQASVFQKTLVAIGLLGIGFSHAGGISHGEILAGALWGYVVSAQTEWAWHRYMLHMTGSELKAFRNALGDKAKRLLAPFRSHTGNHHAIFTGDPAKYSIETNTEWNSASFLEDGTRTLPRRDALAVKHGDSETEHHANEYGMTMDKLEVRNTAIGTMGLAAIMSHIFGFGVEGYVTTMAIAPLTGPATKFLHYYLHLPREVIEKNSNAFARWLTGTPYFRFISRQHYIHHVDTGTNHSLFLPGPDWFFGNLRKPEIEDLLRMEEMGILY